MVSKTLMNASTAGALAAFVGGVYVYTMRAVSKDGIEEGIARHETKETGKGQAPAAKANLAEMPLPPSEQLQREWLTVIVLGASGGLALNKVFPALRGLEQGRFLPRHTRIVAAARTHNTTEGFRRILLARESQGPAPSASVSALDGVGAPGTPSAPLEPWPERAQHPPSSPQPSYAPPSGSSPHGFLQLITYHQLARGPSIADSVPDLIRAVERIEAEQPGMPHHRLYYLAIPEPHVNYPELCARLSSEGRSATGGWTRLVLEKPFGRDAETCRRLNASLAASFREDSLYRIDRYLGKEIVENLLVMRFANRLLSPIWNRDNISNVQILFKETAGPDAQGRAAYFDRVGIVRDVVQSHLLQLLALIAMDRPASLSPEDVRAEKLKVLRQCRPVAPEDVVLGQYGAAAAPGPCAGHGAYLGTPGVDPGSQTATFATVIAYINNERWDGVPFIIKAGKALNERKSEIRIQLKDVSGDIFAPGDVAKTGRNELVLRMQPQEEMYLKMVIKEPGRGVRLQPAELELSRKWYLSQARKAQTGEAPRRAFERLLLDAMLGDQCNFIRGDEMEASWHVLDGVLAAADAGRIPLHSYPFGSAGPDAANDLRRSKGHVPSVYSSERDARSATPWDGTGASAASSSAPLTGKGTSRRFQQGAAGAQHEEEDTQLRPPSVSAVAGAAALGMSGFGRAPSGGCGGGAVPVNAAAAASSGALAAELAKQAAAGGRLAPAMAGEDGGRTG